MILTRLNSYFRYFERSVLINNIRFSEKKFCSSVTTSDKKPTLKEIEDGQFVEVEEEVEEDLFLSPRNKSGLARQHFNIMHGRPPYKEPMHRSHTTLLYKRKMYGLYGNDSDTDPAICFHTKEEIEDIQEYEKVLTPHSIQQMKRNALEALEKSKQEYLERERKMSEADNMQEQWMREIKQKAEMKLAEAAAEKAKRDKLIEEVKRHFGYRVDPKEERFQLLLEEKEKEQTRQKKKEKKKKREEELMARIAALEVSTENKQDPSDQSEKIASEEDINEKKP